ncbi:MAG: MBL fold metallo-hydrolase [Alphaproteobacteria bacterium]|nr:MBL fold metallo-hydrolase [Alphaproteobacteria bacterium]
MKQRLMILGCGPSGGVPRIGPDWGQCEPSNPRNRRRRCAVLVDRFGKRGRTSVLIDTPPDLREQLIDARVRELDGVLFTHDHADHTHGIDDLRMVCYAMKRRVDVYFDQPTRDSLVPRFAYCFQTKEGSGYQPILHSHDIEAGKGVRIEGAGGPIEALAVPQMHGDIASLGFRFGKLAYSPDISGFPEGADDLLRGLDVWIVDALRHTPHPSHFHVKRALEWIERLQPKRAILTHMTTELDYDALRRSLPENVEPAYDGMTIEFDGRFD